MTAGALGLLSTLVLAGMVVRFPAGAPVIVAAGSWLDRFTIAIEPLLGALGLFVAIGLWGGWRWAAPLFAGWAVVVAAQLTLVAVLVTVMAGFAWRPLIVWVLLLLTGGLFATYRLVRAVWHWLPPTA